MLKVQDSTPDLTPMLKVQDSTPDLTYELVANLKVVKSSNTQLCFKVL